MYRIAICDDDKEFIDYIKKIIIELGMNYNNTEYYEYESGELFINALKKNIDKVTEEYKDKYAEFYDRFCCIDDGHAAERVVKAVFGN